MKTFRIAIVLSALGLLCLASPDAARADVVQLNGFTLGTQCANPPCLSGQVTTQGFANVGSPAPQIGQMLASPYVLVVGPGLGSNGGPINTLTYSLASGGNFQFLKLDNFLPFGTSALSNFGNGAITIDFAEPVGEFGFQAQNFDAGSTTFYLQAFNGLTSLGTFSVTGSTVFLGLRADDPVITRIIVSTTGNNFAIGETSIGFNSPATGTPEPATMTLLGTGLLGAAALNRKRRKAGGAGE
ncbi:MAG TPA: PEP-CTERM sorting domain-containing protein [Pyrinomonadaceae bacterium]|nr:PEP-CTERM sorting domain-containing protein [Pyrinomonadaceae bacterium]